VFMIAEGGSPGLGAQSGASALGYHEEICARERKIIMATNVPIPVLSESISEIILLQWLKKEGEYVKQDEPLAELETDKANTVLPAPLSGVLHQVRKAGETLKVGELAATIDETATAP